MVKNLKAPIKEVQKFMENSHNMTKYKKWNDQDIEYLKNNYNSLSVKELSTQLSTTEKSVTSKITRLGLKKDYCSDKLIQLGYFKTKRQILNSKEYRTWRGMLSRCYNSNRSHYHRYGGRGISVCKKWRKFYNFYLWCRESGHKKHLSLDRIDNNCNYYPNNCKWSTKKEQAQNQSTNKVIEAFGETKVLAEWLRDARCAVSSGGLQYRLNKGWSPEDAITVPARCKP